MTQVHASARYVDITRRMNAVTGLGALGISALMTLNVWGDPHKVAVIVGVQLGLVAFNSWVTLHWLRRTSVGRAELARLLVNTLATALVAPATGWPPAVWLWLPFVALAFDQIGIWVARTTLFALAIVMDVLALRDGVDFMYPLGATLFALFCSEVSNTRFGVIRQMLLSSDEERAELARAHQATQEAHQQLHEETRARQQVELELQQVTKLEAVGRLAAGIAHEINTPVQFVGDSLRFMGEASRDLVALVERQREAVRSILEGAPPAEALRAANEAEEDADFAYLSRELPKALVRSLDGLDRITTIVRSMKTFAHPDRGEMTDVDLNGAIEATLAIARGEYKHVADIVLDIAPLPLVRCYVGEINQVILNLVVNASHAIADRNRGTQARGKITITTRSEDHHVTIGIGDTGAGIPEAIREKIFEPFFTTKEVGRGSGQGLAIARSVIAKHDGTLSFESTVGIGTTFLIRLPIGPGRRSIAA